MITRFDCVRHARMGLNIIEHESEQNNGFSISHVGKIHGWFQSLNSWVWYWYQVQVTFHMAFIYKKPPSLSTLVFQDLNFPHWRILIPLPVTKKSVSPASKALKRVILWPCFLSFLLVPRASEENYFTGRWLSVGHFNTNFKLHLCNQVLGYPAAVQKPKMPTAMYLEPVP